MQLFNNYVHGMIFWSFHEKQNETAFYPNLFKLSYISGL